MRGWPEIEDRLTHLRKRLEHYRKHLRVCMDAEDWHGVEDCGSDIRDLQSAIAELEWVSGDK